MKKTISILLVMVLCLAFLPFAVSAASASANLAGPGTVRAGDTITLSFNLSGSNLFGASGTLSYDSNQVTLAGTSQRIGSPWMVEFNGNNFVAYDNNLSSPINGTKTLFTATFKVKSVGEGTAINISYTNVVASDGTADASVGTVTYSKTVAPPLSENNNLAGLTVENATISPAFSAGNTEYTASVPFEVESLKVNAVAADGKAKVAVNSPVLTPAAKTSVTVTVTAENGAQKTYTILVERAQDPNYVPSSNNRLSGIQVEGFLLSPVFDPETTKYVVWLPYETESIQVGATAEDGKASVVVVGGDTLAAGQDNTVSVICTAENGDKKEYTVIAKRAAAHDGSVEEVPEEKPVPETSEDELEKPEKTKANGIAWWWLLIVGFVFFAVGGVCGFFVKDAPFVKQILKKKKK